MAYNLRSRSIAETLRNEEDNDEILGASDSESEDNVSEQAEESDEYCVSDDGSDEDGDDDMAMEWENASLMQRLLGSAARGRPRTQLKGKDGFVWNTNLAQRQSGMLVCACIYVCVYMYVHWTFIRHDSYFFCFFDCFYQKKTSFFSNYKKLYFTLILMLRSK